jgi:tetratricopeptide (TPR) repeat protein
VLIDNVRQPGDDADVRLWYQATLGYKLSHEQLDTPHFNRALQLFPEDAAILLLNGALHDAFADPRVQALVRDAALPKGARLDVASEQAQLRKAADLYRRAFEADPAHVESRLRYARALGRLGQHNDAALHLRALDDTGDELLAYYRQLFLGAEEEALGRFDAARAAYQKAAAHFPRSQAPRLALSQLLHRSGDRVAARAALVLVLQPYGQGASDDPWWVYRNAPGRHASRLIASVYRTLAVGGTQ